MIPMATQAWRDIFFFPRPPKSIFAMPSLSMLTILPVQHLRKPLVPQYLGGKGDLVVVVHELAAFQDSAVLTVNVPVAAAALVKVITSIPRGSIFSSLILWVSLAIRVVVFPLPGTARSS